MTNHNSYNATPFGLSRTIPQWIQDSAVMEVDVTAPFQSRYPSNVSLISSQGFLLEINENPNLTINNSISFWSREYSNVNQRPYLKVVYQYPIFGGDPGNGWDGSTTVLSRVQKVKADNLNVLRYFACEDYGANKEMVSRARQEGMKLVMVYSCGGEDGDEFIGLDGGYSPANVAGSFADFVEYRLSRLETELPGVIGDTIIAVQLGNEDDLKWGGNALDGTLYNGGQLYASYYLAARDRIKAYGRWPQLDICCGSIQDSKSLDYYSGGIESPSATTLVSDRLTDNGNGSRAFLNGFIQGVKYLSNGDISKLPEILPIHGYTAGTPPEAEHEGDGKKEWIERINTIFNICKYYGYYPRIAETEFGFSPRPEYMHGYTGANEQTQAVYYLRRALMDATMKKPASDGSPLPVMFDYVIYWQHPYNYAATIPPDPDESNQSDTGWYANSSLSDPRAIQYVGDILHDTSLETPSNKYPGLQNARIWIPAWSARSGSGASEDNTLTCGWINPKTQKKWGAIWRYRNNLYDYNPISSAARSFVTANGSYPGEADVYKFVFVSNDNPVWTKITTIAGNTYGSAWKYDLPSTVIINNVTYNICDCNPTFLRFPN